MSFWCSWNEKYFIFDLFNAYRRCVYKFDLNLPFEIVEILARPRFKCHCFTFRCTAQFRGEIECWTDRTPHCHHFNINFLTKWWIHYHDSLIFDMVFLFRYDRFNFNAGHSIAIQIALLVFRLIERCFWKYWEHQQFITEFRNF